MDVLSTLDFFFGPGLKALQPGAGAQAVVTYVAIAELLIVGKGATENITSLKGHL
jgi:hypothetical protein